MKNRIKTYCLVTKLDSKSERVANKIRKLNETSAMPLEETDDGDLVIAIGGDGTFIDAVTNTNFSKEKIYTGVHTGTLGFLQDLSEGDILTLIKYIHFEKELKVRKIYTALIKVFLKDGSNKEFFALNELQVGGQDYTNITFAQYIHGELLQNVTATGIIMATNTGDTAYSLNNDGAVDFSNNFQLVCTLMAGNKNAVYERFITNPIICSQVNLIMKTAENISILVDGKKQKIDSRQIKEIEVSMLDDSNYINKLDIMNYSKVDVIRTKILGY